MFIYKVPDIFQGFYYIIVVVFRVIDDVTSSDTIYLSCVVLKRRFKKRDLFLGGARKFLFKSRGEFNYYSAKRNKYRKNSVSRLKLV